LCFLKIINEPNKIPKIPIEKNLTSLLFLKRKTAPIMARKREIIPM